MKMIAKAQAALSKKGEGYVDSGIKILIAVVIGALLLVGLIALFNTVVMPKVNTEVTDMFDAAPSVSDALSSGEPTT